MKTAPRWRQLLARLALGLCLLASQQHAIAHWLSHAVVATHAKATGLPAGEHCSECDSLVAFEASPTAANLPLPPAPAFTAARLVGRHAAPPAVAAPPVYRSRAPPLPR